MDFLSELGTDTILVLSGDITFKGSQEGYDNAMAFFAKYVARGAIKSGNILVCPGNHDIMPNNPFLGIDAFTYSLRRDKRIQFSTRTTFSILVDDVYFIVSNSSYHFNHKYGLSDLDSISEALRQTPPPTNSIAKVFVTHHHLFPLFEHDASVTRNAYALISLLDQNKFNLILHGHQHFAMGFPAGYSPVHTFGVGSFNLVNHGVMNGFNLYELSLDEIRVSQRTLVLDGPLGSHSGFIPVNNSHVISKK